MKKKILVVDDQQNVRTLLQTLLTYMGFEVNTVGSPEEMLDYIGSPSVQSVQLDLLVSDLDCPGKNAGILVIQEVKKRFPNTPAILMSGGCNEEELGIKAQTAGADGFLCKPFGLPQLMGKIEEVLKVATT